VQKNPKGFNCETCSHKHCDSDNPAPFFKWVVPNVIESKTCLLPMITPLTHQILRYREHYKKGFLPWGGGMLNQPNKFLKALEVLGHE
jgi:hypothetical protein